MDQFDDIVQRIDERDEALVIIVKTKYGERYFSGIFNGRIRTAWSLPGAKLFLNMDEKIEKFRKLLTNKGYKTFDRIVGKINHPINW